jgi:hypothetical protein
MNLKAGATPTGPRTYCEDVYATVEGNADCDDCCTDVEINSDPAEIS